MANCQATFRAQSFFTKQQWEIQIKEKWSFSFVMNVKWLLNRKYTKTQLSQKHNREDLKITHLIDF